MGTIVGRDQEIKQLEKLLKRGEAAFLAVYGRRRVGKTHLVREYFSKRSNYFELMGLKDGQLLEQLYNFSKALSKIFYNNIPILPPKNWQHAFELLTVELDKQPTSKKQVIFFDELPWLAGRRSGFIQALDHIWNSDWSRRKNLIVVVCGSAASWMLEHLINAKGGLYNRLTNTILLEPFNLYKTEQFLKSRGLRFNQKQILTLYTVMGGIPHYLKQLEKGKSAIQNINQLCFTKNGLLYREFRNLFESLFDAASVNLDIVRAISKNRYGISRNALIEATKIASGGTLNKRLNELESSGFIQAYVPYGKKKKDKYYRINDEYTMFYLHWIEPLVLRHRSADDDNYWLTKSQTPAWKSWAGYAFEIICFKHIRQIKKALGLNTIACEVGNWIFKPKQGSKEQGAQVDLFFDRADGFVSFVEIKQNETLFIIDKTYARNLLNKQMTFEKYAIKNKQMHQVLLTSGGLKKNSWSEDLIDDHVALKDLFWE